MKKPITFLYILCSFLAISFLNSCHTETQSLGLNPLFTDHMVLQQQVEVAFWGISGSKSKVSVSGSWGEESSTTANDMGDWKLNLPTPEAGGPYTVTISTKGDSVVLNDVLIGEVWLASGQSNMEMPLTGWPPNDTINNSAREIENAHFEKIRMFTVQRNHTVKEVKDFTGEWMVCSPETVGDFSATAYFFARRLHKELNIPVGIIHSSWGGTPAESWTSKKSLKELGDFDKALANMDNPEMAGLIEEWYARWESREFPSTEEGWQQLNFNDASLSQASLDDTAWMGLDLPNRTDQIGDWEMDGVVWLRKTFQLEDVSKDYRLSLGAIDDMDATYVNGQLVGGMAGTGKYNLDRVYTIPASLLRKGANTIAIRVIDTGGGGGVSGPIEISDGHNTKISLEGEWKLLPVAEIYQGKFYVFTPDEAVRLERPNLIQINSHTPSVLFNAMIYPLVPYALKGAIWYQGESNVGRAEQYSRLFPKMITDWRASWNSDFPFYFVQIAPFVYGNEMSPLLRDAQRKTLSTKNTGMVVTMDIGNNTNIHPGNKQDVGGRLAGLALANDYRQSGANSGPLYKSHTVNGNKVYIEFDYTGGGLIAEEGDLSGFEVAGVDKQFRAAKAAIVDGRLEVFSDEIAKPEYVRYAWRDTSIASLFNAEGLPASSFSTQDLE